MLRMTFERVIARLPDRISFRYQTGAYALMLLRWAIGPGMPIRALRRSPLAGLLDKPSVRAALARAHDGVLRPEHLLYSPGPVFNYVLTFGGYEGDGPDEQVSRPGINLVIQVNFDPVHDLMFERLCPDNRELFMMGGHPVHAELNTLAWARIDLPDTEPDIPFGEALIEEIQTDWVREARDQRDWARSLVDGGIAAADSESQLRLACGIVEYVEHVLVPHAKLWDELTLAAALWVLHEQLAVSRVFQHTFESGLALKDMADAPPPRSLYTKLPRRFGFRPTGEVPGFLTGPIHATAQPYQRDGARCEPPLPGLQVHARA